MTFLIKLKKTKGDSDSVVGCGLNHLLILKPGSVPGMEESAESAVLAGYSEPIITPLRKLRQEDHGCMKPDWAT